MKVTSVIMPVPLFHLTSIGQAVHASESDVGNSLSSRRALSSEPKVKCQDAYTTCKRIHVLFPDPVAPQSPIDVNNYKESSVRNWPKAVGRFSIGKVDIRAAYIPIVSFISWAIRISTILVSNILTLEMKSPHLRTSSSKASTSFCPRAISTTPEPARTPWTRCMLSPEMKLDFKERYPKVCRWMFSIAVKERGEVVTEM